MVERVGVCCLGETGRSFFVLEGAMEPSDASKRSKALLLGRFPTCGELRAGNTLLEGLGVILNAWKGLESDALMLAALSGE